MNKYTFAFPLLLLTTLTQAHVVLLDPAAAAGSSYRAALRVGHGCGATGCVRAASAAGCSLGAAPSVAGAAVARRTTGC